MNSVNQPIRFGQMISFFLPLGFSASLVTISHVIINSTLARAAVNPEVTIAGYAIAMSVFALTERSAILLRQTVSARVADRATFNSLLWLAACILAFVFGFAFIIGYTPAGKLLFAHVFGAAPELQESILAAYRILMFVTLFSVIRCIYQGIIISRMRTTWLTIGMVIRLSVMYVVALYFMNHPQLIDGRVGAAIFLAGMMVEALVSYLEGRFLVRSLPEQLPENDRHRLKSLFRFYLPMLLSSFIAVSVGPSINAMLGKTSQIELAIASYAVAFSVTQLVVSFFSYMHQIVLNFYRRHPAHVFRFGWMFGAVPGILLVVIGFTAAGPWFLHHIIGISGDLLTGTQQALRVFVLFAIVFPWVDFCNGLLMLNNQTRIMVWSQSSNILATLAVLACCVWIVPGWNGAIGALAQSIGMAAELGVLILYLYRFAGREANWSAKDGL